MFEDAVLWFDKACYPSSYRTARHNPSSGYTTLTIIGWFRPNGMQCGDGAWKHSRSLPKTEQRGENEKPVWGLQ